MASDRLTQLQDCLDELLTQMYASLSYIYYRHPYADIPGQPSQAPQAAAQPTANGVTAPAANGDGDTKQVPAAAQNGESEGPRSPLPEPPDVFEATMHELAQDLVVKEVQIEMIIKSLPGIGTSEAEQDSRLRELEAELRQVEEERARKELERQNMVDLLGEVIGKIKRVP